MKLALTSDTHGMLPPIPEADVIVHAGDIGPDRGVRKWFLDEFYPWCREFGKPIYATWGNHDYTQGNMGTILMEHAPSNLIYSVEQSAYIGGKKFWFSPWSPVFGDWAWMLLEPDLDTIYQRIPPDTQVIVSHSPPFGAGDLTIRGEAVGSKALAARMAELGNLELVVCGHIHEDFGDHLLDGIMVMNVSSVDFQYRPREERFQFLDWTENE